MEYRRKNRPKEKENSLLSALKTKCPKAERRGCLEEIKSHTTKDSQGIDGGVGIRDFKYYQCNLTYTHASKWHHDQLSIISYLF